MEVFIVRHGQSMANIGLQIANAKLTALGERQADLLGRELSDVRFDRIYGSTLNRAAQTAAGVARHQSDPSIPVEIVPELVEAGTPECFAGDADFLRSIHPHVKADRMRQMHFDSDAARAAYVLETYVYAPAYERGFDTERTDHEGNVIREKNETILIASHGVFIAYLLSQLVGFPFDENMVVGLNNTGVSRFNLYTFNGIRRIRFKGYNDTRHLPKDALSS